MKCIILVIKTFLYDWIDTYGLRNLFDILYNLHVYQRYSSIIIYSFYIRVNVINAIPNRHQKRFPLRQPKEYFSQFKASLIFTMFDAACNFI